MKEAEVKQSQPEGKGGEVSFRTAKEERVSRNQQGSEVAETN